jgi:hypothetical protein
MASGWPGKGHGALLKKWVLSWKRLRIGIQKLQSAPNSVCLGLDLESKWVLSRTRDRQLIRQLLIRVRGCGPI